SASNGPPGVIERTSPCGLQGPSGLNLRARFTRMLSSVLAGVSAFQVKAPAAAHISGNRDERIIDRPDEFIIDRARPRQHLSYGTGIHRCAGDRLADVPMSQSTCLLVTRSLPIKCANGPHRVAKRRSAS